MSKKVSNLASGTSSSRTTTTAAKNPRRFPESKVFSCHKQQDLLKALNYQLPISSMLNRFKDGTVWLTIAELGLNLKPLILELFGIKRFSHLLYQPLNVCLHDDILVLFNHLFYSLVLRNTKFIEYAHSILPSNGGRRIFRLRIPPPGSSQSHFRAERSLSAVQSINTRLFSLSIIKYIETPMV